MSVWDEVVGQQPTVDTLQAAVTSARADGAAMTHAWLFTGPPGSGRSIAARAFAAALECDDAEAGCGACHSCRTVLAGSHPDVTQVRTEKVVIPVEDARALVPLAQRAPSTGRWRVILVEDADRLNDASGNALLKALEEPTARTVWLLCAPTADDVLVTIRSRTRRVALRTPPVAAVVELLVSRDGVDPTMAGFAARAAQSHIGLARRLALDEQARIRRRSVVRVPTEVRSVGEAVLQAAALLATATEEAAAATTERDEQERVDLLRALGADPSARTQPPHVRGQLADLQRDQKRRARRFVGDMVDRSLVDLLSVYRDVLVLLADPHADLVNAEVRPDLERLAAVIGSDGALLRMEAVREARLRLGTTMNVLLALEAMMLALRTQR
ncbi:MAG TPA: DNA polymerase III subunit delta' [Actinomycetales bacterium]|nr:DNA polymerase III subunit delta' [Actinomycetales bacterium]